MKKPEHLSYLSDIEWECVQLLERRSRFLKKEINRFKKENNAIEKLLVTEFGM